jgi:hypothetical protein
LAAKFVDANKRRFGLRDGGVVPVARCQTHQLHPQAARLIKLLMRARRFNATLVDSDTGGTRNS